MSLISTATTATVSAASRTGADIRVGVTAHFAAAVQEDLAAGRLRAVPIDGLYLHRVLARATDRPASRATEGVMEVLREVVESHVREGRWPNATLA